MDKKKLTEHLSLHEVMNRKDAEGNFILTPLPYTDDHLEPFIGTRTVRFHYWNHLGAYIDRVNKLKGRVSIDSIEDIISKEAKINPGSPLYNNASQVFNHYFYFEQLNPKGIGHPLPMMRHLIEKYYRTWDNLKSYMVEAAMSVFGSGWVYLTTDKEGKSLWIRTFTGTFTPIIEVPLLALDVWEHAYYLDYQDNRRLYVERLFELIDWLIIEKRLPKWNW